MRRCKAVKMSSVCAHLHAYFHHRCYVYVDFTVHLHTGDYVYVSHICTCSLCPWTYWLAEKHRPPVQDCARVTGSFSRTSHLGSPVSQSSKLEMIPPPRRSYVYPMMAPTSPHTAPQASNGLGSTATLLLGSHSAPSLGLGRSAGRSCTNVSLGRARRSSAACGEDSGRQRRGQFRVLSSWGRALVECLLHEWTERSVKR